MSFSSTGEHSSYVDNRSFGQKLGECFRIMFCCGYDEEEDREESIRSMKLQISAPTDFRREEINIPGMSPEQERFVREKALADAKTLYSKLQPLRSSPSSQFAQRPVDPPLRISYEQFTQPRPAPSPQMTSPRVSSQGWGNLKAHGRKISDSFKHGLHVHEERRPSAISREDDSAVEMRGLVKGGQVSAGASPAVGSGKFSEESWESDAAKPGFESRL